MDSEEQDPNPFENRRVLFIRISDDQDIMNFLAQWAAMFMNNQPDEEEDDPDLSDICSEQVAEEMLKLETVDEDVQDHSYPEMESLILAAYRKHNNAG